MKTKNLIKLLTAFLIVAVAICMNANNVFAQDNYSAEVELTSDSYVLEANKTYNLTAKIKNIQIGDNVKKLNSIGATIQLEPSNVFVEMKNSNIQALDDSTTDFSDKPNVTCYTAKNVYFENNTVFLKFTVKTTETINVNTATIKLANVVVTSGTKNTGGTGDIHVNDATVTLKAPEQPQPQPQPEQPQPEQPQPEQPQPSNPTSDTQPTGQTVKADKAEVKAYVTGTSTGIAGVKIALCDEKGNVVKGKDGKEIILTTDANGNVDFAKAKDLVPGTYYYKEVSVPDGYKLNSTLYSFTVNDQGKVSYKNGTNIIYTDAIAKAETKAKTKLPAAGVASVAGIVVIVGAVGTISYLRLKKMNTYK